METQKEFFCDKHGSFFITDSVYSIRLKFGLLPPKNPLCPKCLEEMPEEEPKQAVDTEAMEAEKKEKWKRCGIEPMYYPCDFDNYECYTESQKEAKASIKKLTETKKGKILLVGGNGVGKTHLCVCAIKQLGGELVRMSRLTRRAINFQGGEEAYIEYLCNLPLLVLEEVGRTKASDYELNLLSDIVDTRHARFKPLIMTSNRHFRRSCKKKGCPDCFQNYVSEDVISRFLDGDKIEIQAKDYRRGDDNF